jgi:CS domain
MNNAKENSQDEMSPEERLQWLRDRGVLIETSEERRINEVTKIMKESDEKETEIIYFVYMSHDTSKPLKEMVFNCPIRVDGIDYLMDHLKPVFKAIGREKIVDLDLMRKYSSQTLSSSDARMPSEDTLLKISSECTVEKFALVHATKSNNHTGVNIYLDEAGMLKRLPLNKRASDWCTRAGYNPPPQFYGDVFIGRVKTRPYIQNVSLQISNDTSPDAAWLKQATSDNLEYQLEMNRLTGREDLQAAIVGTDGKEGNEDGYTWTQTDEELEIIIPAPSHTIATKEVKIKFLPQSITVKCNNYGILNLELFEHIDPEGCTWTLDKKGTNVKIVITMEKIERALWPRIKH